MRTILVFFALRSDLLVKAIVQVEYGSPGDLKLRDVPEPISSFPWTQGRRNLVVVLYMLQPMVNTFTKHVIYLTLR